ncbi:She3p SCDLUD_000536 [Saccharomycodes ludwigii]|uniref:She3p n=1 Tax=Saccharomycodes ludwigii TaxID=36035 RepID=UPI001E8A5AF3|nr:hypothetical protein SCDLUD_000536 [Saccharomycodes ludwigii]KAH3902937.1 hypothetical protein SCDLUD_000536 [Saccharomycodes ludwigii]
MNDNQVKASPPKITSKFHSADLFGTPTKHNTNIPVSTGNASAPTNGNNNDIFGANDVLKINQQHGNFISTMDNSSPRLKKKKSRSGATSTENASPHMRRESSSSVKNNNGNANDNNTFPTPHNIMFTPTNSSSSSTRVIESLHQQVDTLTSTNLQLTLQSNNLLNRLEAATLKDAKQTETVNLLKHENENLNSVLNRKTRRNKELEQDLKELKLKYKEISEENKTLSNEMKDKSGNESKLVNELEMIKVQYDALVDAQSGYKKHYENEISKLKTTLVDLTKNQEKVLLENLNKIVKLDDSLQKNYRKYESNYSVFRDEVGLQLNELSNQLSILSDKADKGDDLEIVYQESVDMTLKFAKEMSVILDKKFRNQHDPNNDGDFQRELVNLSEKLYSKKRALDAQKEKLYEVRQKHISQLQQLQSLQQQQRQQQKQPRHSHHQAQPQSVSASTVADDNTNNSNDKGPLRINKLRNFSTPKSPTVKAHPSFTSTLAAPTTSSSNFSSSPFYTNDSNNISNSIPSNLISNTLSTPALASPTTFNNSSNNNAINNTAAQSNVGKRSSFYGASGVYNIDPNNESAQHLRALSSSINGGSPSHPNFAVNNSIRIPPPSSSSSESVSTEGMLPGFKRSGSIRKLSANLNTTVSPPSKSPPPSKAFTNGSGSVNSGTSNSRRSSRHFSNSSAANGFEFSFPNNNDNGTNINSNNTNSASTLINNYNNTAHRRVASNTGLKRSTSIKRNSLRFE